MSSNESKDVRINISIPINGGVDGSSEYQRRGPYGGPPSREEAAARIAALKELLRPLDALLQAAQAAHRAGHLCDGADRLDWLQRWYTDLQAELRCLETAGQQHDQQ